MSREYIDSDLWSLIVRANTVARLMGVEEISIEDTVKGNLIRGFNASMGAPVIINHFIEHITLPFKAFAIHNCGSFIDKIKLAQSRDPDFRAEITIDDNTKIVTSIHFKGKKFKLDFNAGKPETVRAPKGIKDTNAHQFSIKPEDIVSINQSIKAMKAEDITFISDGNVISYEVKSGPKDVFSIDLCESFDSHKTGNDRQFVFSYPFKTIFPVLSKCESHQFNLTNNGLLNCHVDGINVYVVPRI